MDHVQYVRIRNLANVNFKGEFPLWKRDTAEAAKQFVDRGFRAVVVCVDPRYLDQTFVGRPYDRRFLDELPPEVDPCGEEGEFHTFVFDGPIFKRAVHHKIGSIVCRGTFYYADLLPDC